MNRRVLLAAVLSGSLVAGGLSLLGCSPSGDPVLRWHDQTRRAVAAVPVPDVVASRTWAMAWTAAERVVTGGPDDDDALAGAVSGVLVALVPSRRAALRRAVRAGCSSGPAFSRGRAEAGEVLAERAGDGLSPAEVDPGYDPPPPGPGVWRPTPPGFASGGGSGMARARPFDDTAAALRPAAPAALGSDRYRRDLLEVQVLGEAGSTTRSAAQTATARFWAPSSVALFAEVLRPVVVGRPAAQAAPLLALLHRTTLDTTLAVATAKYRDVRWRPVTALRVDDDGDPRTPRRPGWTPLVETPPNPEHPSGHTAYAAAAAAVLERLVGDVPVEVRGRRWNAWQQLVAENEDARVWAGVHLRSSDEAGSALGRAVAREVLSRQGRPPA